MAEGVGTGGDGVMAHVSFQKKPRQTAAERQSQRRRPIGYRDPVKRTNASNSPLLALSKGPSLADEKTARHAKEVEQITLTREQVWTRSEDKCEFCGDTERETAAKSHRARHEMNETIERSKTRGLPPEERFNTRICARNCVPCHRDFHGKLLRIAYDDPVNRLDGSFTVLRKDRQGRWLAEYRVNRQRKVTKRVS